MSRCPNAEINAVTEFSPTTCENSQNEDTELKMLKQHVQSKIRPTIDQIRHCSRDTRVLHSKWNELIVENNILYKTKMVNDIFEKHVIIPERDRIE